MHQINFEQQQKKQQENRRLIEILTKLSQTQNAQFTQIPSQGDVRPSP